MPEERPVRDLLAEIDRLKAAGEFLSIPDLTVHLLELAKRVAALEARLALLERGANGRDA